MVITQWLGSQYKIRFKKKNLYNISNKFTIWKDFCILWNKVIKRWRQLSLSGLGWMAEDSAADRVFWSWGRCQDTFRALRVYPWARYWTLKCWHATLWWAEDSPRGGACHCHVQLAAPEQDQLDKLLQMIKQIYKFWKSFTNLKTNEQIRPKWIKWPRSISTAAPLSRKSFHVFHTLLYEQIYQNTGW